MRLVLIVGLVLGAMLGAPGLLRPSEVRPASLAAETTNALSRLLQDDMSRSSEAYPHGVPRGYDWASRPRRGFLTRKTDFTGFTAWGQLYRCGRSAPDLRQRVEVRDIQAWVLRRYSERWRLLQRSAAVTGAAFPEDYVGPPAPARTTAREGRTVVGLRPNRNFHFWPPGPRAAVDAKNVAGLVVLVRARLAPRPRASTRRPQCFVLSVGGDFWRTPGAPARGFDHSFDAGIGRFKRVDDRWRTFTMSVGQARGFRSLSSTLQLPSGELR